MTRDLRSGRALRRYPALVGALAWCLLAFALPSSLTLPRTGPPTLAEFAPVPGRSSGDVAPLANLAQTSSAGVGSAGPRRDGVVGSATAPAAPDPGSSGPAGKARAGTKRCVGKPPRQTEDPLSPTCVAFFDGDNGGATSRGVTADEVRVVVANWTCGGAANHRNSGPTIVDYDEHPDGGAGMAPQYPAVLGRYFEDRFQTYGRRVHLYWYRRACQGDVRASIALLDELVRPFALVFENNVDAVEAHEAARRGIVTNYTAGSRAAMSERAPYLLSFPPDADEMSRHVAGFLCAVLAGRPARYAGDPLLQNQARRFALAYSRRVDPQESGAVLIRAAVGEGCPDAAGEIAHDSSNHSLDVARWKSDGVTTVMQVGSADVALYAEAQAQGWHPEWFEVPSNGLANEGSRLMTQTQYRNAYGLHFGRMRAQRGAADQEWYRAFREGCGDCLTDASINELYDNLLLLFTGIQAAGPRLTAASVDRGLLALPVRRSPDPWTPAAYFAPGQHFFVRDAAVARWDTAGHTAGASQPGCWRMVEAGRRYRVEDWPGHPGDTTFDAQTWPCIGDNAT